MALHDTALDDDLYDEEDSQKDKFLTFQLQREDYAIETRYVIEIVPIMNITHVPDMPDFVRGVINLRGQVIPVMDVRARFRMALREYDERTCVIVVNINDTHVGLIVDRVSEVTDIPEDCIFPPPKISKDTAACYILGMGKVGEDVKILLDVSKLLFQEELEQLNDSEDQLSES